MDAGWGGVWGGAAGPRAAGGDPVWGDGGGERRSLHICLTLTQFVCVYHSAVLCILGISFALARGLRAMA